MAQGLQRKVRPLWESRDLRRGRKAYPMDDRRRFLYPLRSDGATEKAGVTGGWKSRGKRDGRDAGKSASHKAKARRVRKAAASTEERWASFQEKLLA